MIGKTIDDFTIIRSLGSGGMGNVYLAFQKSLEREIALKVIRKSEISNSKNIVERFIREAKIAASIQHSNIINIYTVGEKEDLFYISMEYVEGKTLKALVEDCGALGEENVWRIAIQICQGLQEAFNSHIIHRDIKPENLILKPNGILKITDFGISKHYNQDHDLTSAGTILGTPDYMSPEQISGAEVDLRSDIYSLGATLYYLLTGHNIFEAESVVDILVKHKLEKVLPPQWYINTISIESSAILGKMLQKQAKNRYQNYEEILQDIESLSHGKALVFAKQPTCFFIYTHSPDIENKMAKKITSRIASWLMGTSTNNGNEGSNKTPSLNVASENLYPTKSLKKVSNTPIKETLVTDIPPNTSSKPHVENNVKESIRHKENNVKSSYLKKQKECLDKERNEKVKKIKDIIKEMASEIDELQFISVIGMDGIPLAKESKTDIHIESFAAKFTMVMRLIQKSVNGLENLGDLEENLVQSNNAWVLTRFLGNNYFLCIAVNRDGILGGVRLASQKYASSLKECLTV